MKISIVYVTHKNQEEAEKITTYLLDKRLIACANFFPIKSVYRWEGKTENQDEIVSLLKTKEENFEKVKDEIEKMHPYEIPCILRLDGEINESYGNWILGETTNE